MPEAMIRGHVLAHTARYFLAESDQLASRRLQAALTLELKAALDSVVPAGWYPRARHVELLGAVVACKGNGDATLAEFMRCGAAMTIVDNDFNKLLLKILTPELFQKRLARFWLRDHRDCGSCELQALDPAARTARVRLHGIAGYDHAGMVWLGWVRRVLEEVSGRSVDAKQTGWGWQSPGPEEIVCEIRWS